MSRVKRRGRDTSQQPKAAIVQLPATPLLNHFSPLQPLSEEQIEMIHQASLTLLEEQGIEVMGEKTLQLFKRAGAQVDSQGCVKLDRHLVQQALSTAPSSFVLHSRNPQRQVIAGQNRINFGLVSGPPNVHDHINGRRMGNFKDYQRLISLGQYFNCISFFGNQAVPPTDLPVNTRHLDTTFANLTLADKPFFTQGIGAGRALDAINLCAIARGVSLEELKASPSVMTNINVNSPRKLDDSMAYGAMQMSMLGQPVAVTPFTLMGAMTPATLGGALVQQNAEVLFGVVLTQLVRPGSPVIYGGFTSNVDMRTGSPAFGTPENSIANMAGGQLARHYSLPYRTSACNASNCVDAQATYETQMALWGAVMGHGNFIYHAAGWLEGGLVASFEKLVIDCEMLQQMSYLLKPLTINLDEIGLQAMQEVGPGGHFFGCEHTLQRYKTAFYEPFLSNWQNQENWQLAGSKNTYERATAIWQSILQEFEPPAMDASIQEELSAYVAKRKEAIGQAEPNLEPDWDLSF